MCPSCLSNQLARRRPCSPTKLSCSRKVSAQDFQFVFFLSYWAYTCSVHRLSKTFQFYNLSYVFMMKITNLAIKARIQCEAICLLFSCVWAYSVSLCVYQPAYTISQLITRGQSLCSDQWKIGSTMTSSPSSLTSLAPVSHVSVLTFGQQQWPLK